MRSYRVWAMNVIDDPCFDEMTKDDEEHPDMPGAINILRTVVKQRSKSRLSNAKISNEASFTRASNIGMFSETSKPNTTEVPKAIARSSRSI